MTASDYFLQVHILYLRCEGAILLTLHMNLPISTNTAGESLKNVTFYVTGFVKIDSDHTGTEIHFIGEH